MIEFLKEFDGLSENMKVIAGIAALCIFLSLCGLVSMIFESINIWISERKRK